jgi:hypothetical protein
MNAFGEEARAHVMLEHARVCALVTELVQEILRVGHEIGCDVVRVRLGALRAAMEQAVDIEERELIPLLRQADAWGPVRVERVRDRHAHMLCAVRAFEDEVTIDYDSCDLVSHTEQLVAALSSDLEEERDAVMASARDEDGTVVVDQEPD